MSIFEFVSYDNMKLCFVYHLSKCDECRKVDSTDHHNFCSTGSELFDNLERALRDQRPDGPREL